MSAHWNVRLLAPLALEGNDGRVERFATRHLARALAYLAYHRGQPVRREVLWALLWPDATPRAGRNRLSNLLSNLRDLLEPGTIPSGSVLRATRQDVVLSAAAVSTDLATLETALVAFAGRPQAHWAELQAAFTQVQGPPLPGLDDAWARALVPRCCALVARSATALVEWHLGPAGGGATLAAAVAWRAVDADPLRQQACELLLTALAAGGDQDALERAWETCRARLEAARGSAPDLPLPPLRQVPAVARWSEPLAPQAGGGTTTVLVMQAPPPGWETVVTAQRGRPEQRGGLATGWFASAGDGGRAALASAMPQSRAALHTADAGTPETTTQLWAIAAELCSAAPPGVLLCSTATASLLRGAGWQQPLRVVGTYWQPAAAAARTIWQLLPDPAEPLPRLALQPHTPTRLPLRAAPLVGRGGEIAALRSLVEQVAGRLITLRGAGGTGKTRLAVELGHRLVEEFGGAVWFIELAGAGSARQAADRIATGLGLSVPPGATSVDQVVVATAGRRGLLVLDNWEQLPAAATGLVLRLRQDCPQLSLLVTSRRALEVSGEVVYDLGPLEVPPAAADGPAVAESPAVRLFAERVQASDPTFHVGHRNWEQVAQLVRALEGLPLALELAARRASQTTIRQLCEQLAGRLDWSASPRVKIPERHRTLRAMLAWSHDLLSPPMARFCDQLAVFEGAFDATTAAVVTADDEAAERLSLLRGWSLLVADSDHASLQWRVLPLVREYLLEVADPALLAAARERHAQYWVARLAALQQPDRTAQEEAAAPLREHLGDLEAAVRHLAVDRPEAALAALVTAAPLWQVSPRLEAAEAALLALLPRCAAAPAPLRAAGHLLRAQLGLGHAVPHELWEAASTAQQVAAEAGNEPAEIAAIWLLLNAIPWLHTPQHLDRAAALVADLQRRQSPGAAILTADWEVTRAIVAGDWTTAVAWLHRGLPLRQALGDPSQLAAAQTEIALLALLGGDLAGAAAALAAVQTAHLGPDGGFWLGRVAWLRSTLALQLDDLPQALSAARAVAPVAVCRAIAGDLAGLLGDLAARSGQPLAAARWSRYAERRRIPGTADWDQAWRQLFPWSLGGRWRELVSPAEARAAATLADGSSLADLSLAFQQTLDWLPGDSAAGWPGPG